MWNIYWTIPKQTIVFIDPKGLMHIGDLNHEKIQFHKQIKEIERMLSDKCQKEITLESFILSATPYEELKKGKERFPSKEDFENNHVIFLKDQDWAEKLFDKLRCKAP